LGVVEGRTTTSLLLTERSHDNRTALHALRNRFVDDDFLNPGVVPVGVFVLVLEEIDHHEWVGYMKVVCLDYLKERRMGPKREVDIG
jgi:hypothetical protein